MPNSRPFGGWRTTRILGGGWVDSLGEGGIRRVTSSSQRPVYNMTNDKISYKSTEVICVSCHGTPSITLYIVTAISEGAEV